MVRELVKVSTLKPGDKFLDEDGDVSVLLPMKTRPASYAGEEVKCRFYSTLDEKGEPVVVACAIPNNATVQRYFDD